MLKAVRGTYQTFTDKEKAELTKKAAECGIISIIQYFTKTDGQKTKTNNVLFLPVAVTKAAFTMAPFSCNSFKKASTCAYNFP